MDRSPLTLSIVGLVWTISVLAGVTLIRGALAERRAGRPGSARRSWARRAAGELRFRLRLAAGAGLIAWVVLGVIWALANWN